MAKKPPSIADAILRWMLQQEREGFTYLGDGIKLPEAQPQKFPEEKITDGVQSSYAHLRDNNENFLLVFNREMSYLKRKNLIEQCTEPDDRYLLSSEGAYVADDSSVVKLKKRELREYWPKWNWWVIPLLAASLAFISTSVQNYIKRGDTKQIKDSLQSIQLRLGLLEAGLNPQQHPQSVRLLSATDSQRIIGKSDD